MLKTFDSGVCSERGGGAAYISCCSYALVLRLQKFESLKNRSKTCVKVGGRVLMKADEKSIKDAQSAVSRWGAKKLK